MRIFVTGGGGFLGRSLLQGLAAQGHEVVAPSSKECNLLRDDALRPWADHPFDRIFHLAAWTQAGDFCLRHPGEQWLHNQRINTQVLEWWATCQRQAKLITIGTSCAYAPELPLSEEYYLEGQPIESLHTYAMTKRMLWVGQCALSKQFGLRHLCVVPSTLYGPSYHTDGRQMHFIFDLIRKILAGREQGSPVELWGNGEQRREIIHVSDFLAALLHLSDSYEGLVNIGAGEEYTIKTFAHAICAAVGYDPASIQYDLTKYVGAKSKCLQTGKLRGLMPGFHPRPLDSGLPEVIAWMREFLKSQRPSA